MGAVLLGVRLITGDPEASQWAQHIERAPLVLAPELMLSEVANTLWKLHRAGHLSAQDPQELQADARDLMDQIEPDPASTWPWPGEKQRCC